jgi:integrase
MTGMRSGELYALEWTDVNFETKLISVTKSYSKRAKFLDVKRYPDGIKGTKSGECREIPLNQELEGFLKEQKAKEPNRRHVLPRIPAWTNSDQARHLKGFCVGIGIRPICFHALRACFATQLLQHGVAPVVVMAIAGWRDMETMMRYIRMAGVDIKQGTAPLRVLSPKEEIAKVFYLNPRG